MKLLSFPDIFKKLVARKESGMFSDFFLHASTEKKIRVFKEVAQKANEDQRELFERSKLELKKDKL